jgi:hypothetical protein
LVLGVRLPEQAGTGARKAVDARQSRLRSRLGRSGDFGLCDLETGPNASVLPRGTGYPELGASKGLQGSQLHQLVADRIAHESGGRGELELAHDRRAMRLDRLDAYAEERADFPVGVALGNQLDDTALSIGKGCSRSIAPREKRLQQRFRDPVGEKRLVGGEGGNGLEQMALRIGFEKVAARSGAQEVENEGLVLTPCEDEDLDPGKPPAKMMRDLDPVHNGQCVLDDGNVGLGGNGIEDRLLAIGCLCDDLPIRLSFQGLSQPEPNHLTIVGNQNAGHVRQAKLRSARHRRRLSSWLL